MILNEAKRYDEALAFLESLKNIPLPDKLKKLNAMEQRKTHKPRLEFLLKMLGNPERGMKYIHVTGTSGKGSVTTLIHSILSEAGFKTGGFLSPHITTPLERIRINDRFISAGEFCDTLEHLKPFLTRCALECPYGVPAFFEVILAMSFLYFKKNKCQYCVLEVGVGGEYDPTNTVARTEVAVITNVGIDHKNVLGDTKTAIARDKAGIAKPGCRLITSEKSPAMIKIFKEFADKRKVASFERASDDYQIIKNDINGLEFSYGGYRYRMGLPGVHQAKNAILAIMATEKIVKGDYGAIARGLSKVRMPARLEIIQRDPLVILDGAHNPDKIDSTVAFVKELKPKRVILLTTLAGNKDFSQIFSRVVPLADRVVLTRFRERNRQSSPLKRLYEAARKEAGSKVKISVHIEPWQALDEALAEAKKGDLVLITGSFFLAGDLRRRWWSVDDIIKNREMF